MVKVTAQIGSNRDHTNSDDGDSSVYKCWNFHIPENKVEELSGLFDIVARLSESKLAELLAIVRKFGLESDTVEA